MMGARGPAPLPLSERLARRTEQSGKCVIWIGSVNRDGYGRMSLPDRPRNRRNVLVHRVAYELAHGPIPAGLVVMHTCDNPACVNVDHLRVATQAENMADMYRKGRGYRKVDLATYGQVAA